MLYNGVQTPHESSAKLADMNKTHLGLKFDTFLRLWCGPKKRHYCGSSAVPAIIACAFLGITGDLIVKPEEDARDVSLLLAGLGRGGR